MKLYMFRTVPLFIIRSFSLYTQQWCMSHRFADRLRSCQKTCMTYTIAVCTLKNSWWWTEELSETCRVSFRNKFEKLVHLVGFIIRICHDAWSHEHKRWLDLFRVGIIIRNDKTTQYYSWYSQANFMVLKIILLHPS